MTDKLEQIGNSFILKSVESDAHILDAYGDVVKYSLEAGFPTDDTTGDPSGFDTTVVEVGTGTTIFAHALTAGNVATITTAANEYDGGNYQLKGSPFIATAGKPIYFHAEVAASDATQSDLLIGLAGTDTALMATTGGHALAVAGDGLFFSKLDAVTSILANTYLAGASKNSGSVGVLDTDFHTYDIFFDGTNVKFYFDYALVSTFTASLPTAVMRPSINFRAGAAAAKVLTIKSFSCIQVNG